MARRDIIRVAIDSNPAMQALGDNYPAVAALFNARPQVANPAQQQQVAKRLSLRDAFGAIAQAAPADLAAIGNVPGWIVDRVEAAMAANDRVATANFLAIIGTYLSGSSKTALTAMLQATEPDPAWTATIPGDSIAMTLGVAPVTAADVQEALN